MVWCSFSKIHSNFHLCNNQQLWHHNPNVLFYLLEDNKGIITQSCSQHLADLTPISFLHCTLILQTWVNVLCFTFVIWKTYVIKSHEQYPSVIKLFFHMHMCINTARSMSSHETMSIKLFKWKNCLQIIVFIELFILMKLKATFTYFISKGGLQFYRILQSFSSCNQNTDTLVPVFIFQKALLETQFPIQCPLSVDLLGTHQ